jgi:hypothetical protein
VESLGPANVRAVHRCHASSIRTTIAASNELASGVGAGEPLDAWRKAKSNWVADHAPLRGSRGLAGAGWKSKIRKYPDLTAGGELEASESKEGPGRGARPIRGQSCPAFGQARRHLAPNVRPQSQFCWSGLLSTLKDDRHNASSLELKHRQMILIPHVFPLQAVLRPLAALRLEALSRPLAT